MNGTHGSATPLVQDLVKVVAVDGPAGSGKSTVARRVALALGWRFVDTGATYRAVTLAVLRSGADVHDRAAVAAVAGAARIELITDPRGPSVLLDGEDVSIEVRGPDVTAHVSAVSALPRVREQLIAVQRCAMGTAGAVVEGRDISTVVAPQAAVKVYLDADPAVRASRRASELASDVTAAGLTTEQLRVAVGQALARRDEHDNQTNAQQASDGAVHIDTSSMSIEQVVEFVVLLVEARGLR